MTPLDGASDDLHDERTMPKADATNETARVTPEELPDYGFENLWCSDCLERFYSAAADQYVGTPCSREGCSGKLLAGAPTAGLRSVK